MRYICAPGLSPFQDLTELCSEPCRPNPAFTQKVITTSLCSQVLDLVTFKPLPHDDEEYAMVHELCPVRALSIYMRCLQPIRQTDQLFVCFGTAARGKPVTAERFSHWLTDPINWAYESMGLPPLAGVHAHSTRGLAASRGFKGGVGRTFVRRCHGARHAPLYVFIC